MASKNRPALTREAKQNQLISLAIDQAEEQLRNKKASSQVLTHFLKLATVQAELDLERQRKENMMIEAKTKALQSSQNMEELTEKAIKAFKTYSGQEDEDYETE